MRAALGRLVIAVAVAVFLAGLLLTACGFVIGGTYLWLADRLDPATAAVWIGGVLLLLGGVTGLFVWLMLSRQRPMFEAGRLNPLLGAHPASGTSLGLAQAVGDWVGQDGREFLRRNAVSAMFVALGCGFALGVSPRLRRALWSILR